MKGLICSILVLVSSAEAGAMSAYYTVPVTDPALVPYAEFRLGNVKREFGSRRLRLRYELPIELIGKKVRIEMEGTPNGTGTFELRGPHGTAKCTRDACEMRYVNLDFRLENVDGFLRTRWMEEEEYKGRLAVAKRFGEDPFGVIEFDGSPAVH